MVSSDKNHKLIADGECRKLEGATSYYMGFMKDGFYDAVNMQTHNYVSFTRAYETIQTA